MNGQNDNAPPANGVLNNIVDVGNAQPPLNQNEQVNLNGFNPPPLQNGQQNFVVPNLDPNVNANIHAIVAKVPFPAMQNVTNIELWFAQIRSWFDLNNVRSDNTMFNLVVSHLRQEVLEQVEEFVRNPPQQNKFVTIRDAIIGRFADSTRARVHKLISGITLGDKKPSTLLQELRRANIGNDESLLKDLWLQRLPVAAQMTVSVAQGNLTQVATVADALVETLRLNGNQAGFGQVNALDGASTFGIAQPQTGLERKMEELTKLIASMKSNDRSRSKHRSQPEGRKGGKSQKRQSSPPVDSGLCWHHYTFGSKARKCGRDMDPPKPCSWVSKNE